MFWFTINQEMHKKIAPFLHYQDNATSLSFKSKYDLFSLVFSFYIKFRAVKTFFSDFPNHPRND
jgi:hypothetical protein